MEGGTWKLKLPSPQIVFWDLRKADANFLFDLWETDFLFLFSCLWMRDVQNDFAIRRFGMFGSKWLAVISRGTGFYLVLFFEEVFINWVEDTWFIFMPQSILIIFVWLYLCHNRATLWLLSIAWVKEISGRTFVLG